MMPSFSRTVTLVLLAALAPASAFIVRQPTATPSILTSLRSTHQDAAENPINNAPLNQNAPLDRRQALGNSVSGATALMSLLNLPSPAFAADSFGSSPDSPIVVLGAGGKVGKLATEILANKGLYVRATTRSGRQVLESDSKFVAYTPCDVTNDESLKSALAGASGCIFAASASGKKKGGEPIVNGLLT
ncbi:MAG: hypothetical protein SGARI_004778 [Bacillariaceae sp.]